jgi:hypothetical protein
MALNTKVVDKLVLELLKEKTQLPYTQYVLNESTQKRYMVSVTEVISKVSPGLEPLVKSNNYGTVLGPKGLPCDCCNGSGRQ